MGIFGALFGGGKNQEERENKKREKRAQQLYLDGKYLADAADTPKKKQAVQESLKGACELGHRQAMYDLIQLYYRGKYQKMRLEKDYEKAIFWMQRFRETYTEPEDKDYSWGEISYQLSQCYRWGRGTEQNHQEELKCLEESVGAGYPRAASALGEIYFDEIRMKEHGFSEDPSLATKWYVTALNMARKIRDKKAKTEAWEGIERLARRGVPEAVEEAHRENERTRCLLKELEEVDRLGGITTLSETQKKEALMRDWLGREF